jgi:AcrR family transcriptional regulator
MANPRKPRWQRRKDERPAEIISAALAVFAARGFAATRLDDVARRAGISKGTLYLYFRNKEDLFKAMVRETLVPNIALAEAQLGDDATPTPELLSHVLRGMVSVIASPIGAIPKLVISEAGNFPDLARFYVEEVVARGLGVLGRLLARGVQRGEFRKINPASIGPVVVGPLMVLAMWTHALKPHTPAPIQAAFELNSFFETYIDVILRGLLAKPPRLESEGAGE